MRVIAAAEQTAALRAALRRFLRERDGHTLDCPAMTKDDSSAVCEAEYRCIATRALLADPEGERAAEEWRALQNLVRVITDHANSGDRHCECKFCVALAAVERSRQR